ncbi:polysaccharide export outer membrane protein [Brevundimonas nasdae]|jgi:protein involved in polysaccharide export with SLBB domain|uniref:Polysaccharide export protein n=1 Tax=Brevundimonas nasdae TaxID=172043 RepID=A0ABX8TJX7_9CAUL|nr:polysaccharide biosynthesis/export family protein [Brevundimonas nasdae]MBK6025698.1 polysaccharide export protein [Brevundimonas nasdae]MDQ0452454.1 polysaccharide export outer membrane protein [Brevundimonas nasdae]QYC10393.1 polysaccharide export protein [Brevundimonas nasdae]QYC13181.1 polysaccharide export protein [Brevundimonas nasdae]
MLNWLRAGLVGLMLVVGVSGCASSPAGAESLAAIIAPSGDEPVAVRSVPEYRLGAADKVRVNVFGEEALTGEFIVGGSGKVSLPLIGEVQAAGLTIGQFQEEIAQALRQGYINEPRVSAEVLNYRPFYILGEVKKPGEYPYTNNLTVLNAVATAEGFSYRANTRVVYIKRADGVGEQAFPLTTATQVAPGDTIRIGERFF